MIPNNYLRLIKSLSVKTQNGLIFWNRASDTQFKLVLNSNTITVDYWRNKGDMLTGIDIYNLNGNIIDRYIASKKTNPQEFTQLYGFYMEIYNVVNKKLEQTINNILGEINRDGVIGKKDE